MSLLESGIIGNTKLLLRVIEKVEEKTASGIFKPITVKDPNVSAEILKIGSGVPQNVGEEFKIGMVAIFSPHAPPRLQLQGEDYLILDYREVLFRYSKS